MALDFGIVCSLHNQPEPPTELLERAHGEFGLDHVTACAVAGAGHLVYLGQRDGPREFRLEPGWQYPPDLARFDRCELRPRPARGVGRHNGLAGLAGSASALGIRLFVRLDLRAALLAVESAAPFAMRNAWGEPMPGGGPCVSQPAVRELLRVALLELAGYNPSGLEVVEWWPDRPVCAGGERPVQWNPLARRLLDVCFCDACRQIAAAAGVDPDQAARSVQVHWRSVVASDAPPTCLGRLQLDQVLTAYLRSRHEESQRWLAALVSVHGSHYHMLVERAPTVVGGRAGLESDPTGWWPPLAAPKGWVLVRRFPFAAGGGWAEAAAGGGLSLPAWRPEFRESSELVRFVQDALGSGARFFDFERLDLDPPEALTWLRQAVRFARRGPVPDSARGRAD